MGERQLIHIGFGNTVSSRRLISIVSPESAPIRRLVQEARENGHLIDATYGRRTRAVIIMDSDHVVLSAFHPVTVAHRWTGESLTSNNREKSVDLLKEDKEMDEFDLLDPEEGDIDAIEIKKDEEAAMDEIDVIVDEEMDEVVVTAAEEEETKENEEATAKEEAKENKGEKEK